MSEMPEGALRISDTDRESAMSALGEHLSAGRLDVDEYGERSARVTTAKTRDELTAVFTDLPHPHPRLGTEPPAVPPPSGDTATQPESAPSAGVTRGIWGSAVTVIVIAAVVLFLATHQWWWFLMIPLATMVGGRGYGHHRFDHRGGRQRMRRRY
jgi:hypothetical protein